MMRVGRSFFKKLKAQKQLAQNIEKVSEREIKLARLMSGLIFLLAKTELYSP
jgi:hypothetical protein